MVKLKPLSIILALLLSGCVAQPDAARFTPDNVKTGPFLSQNPQHQTDTDLPDTWWQLYQDPLLDRLVQQALVSNRDLKVAAANLRRAQSRLRLSGADRLPQTGLNAGMSYGDNQVQGQDAQWSEQAGLAVSWEVDLWGRIDQAIDAASADLRAEQAAQDSVRIMVAAETARAYFNVCTFGYQTRVEQRSLANSMSQLTVVEAKVAAGSATQLELNQAQSVVASSRARLPLLEASRRNAAYELSALLGEVPGNLPGEIANCFEPPALVTSLPVGDGTELLRRRPDLRQAEQQLAADIARVGVATADLYPRVTLGAELNYLNNDTLRGSDRYSYGIGPLISWSFPNTVAVRARIDESKAVADASLEQFNGAVLTALKEVEQALSSVNAQQQQRDQLLIAQQTATQAYQLAQARYDAGALAYVDLLVNQQTMLNARSAYAASIQQLADTQVNLFKALGGGWQHPADDKDS